MSTLSGVLSDFPPEAVDKAFTGMRVMFDWHKDLCKAGVHPDSPFHPLDCPERKDSVLVEEVPA